MTEHTESILNAIAAGPGTPRDWTPWPGGWPGEIDVALVDAVYSARAQYRTRNPQRGVLAAVTRWKDSRGRKDSLPELVREIDEVGPENWADKFDNRQLSPGRQTDAPGGPTKAAAVSEAASRLISRGVRTSSDVGDTQAIASAMRSVSGIGTATTNYFLILLGRPGVKPDTMVHRFLTNATGRSFSDSAAVDEVVAAADRLGASSTHLEHAIWAWQREQ